MLLKDSKQKRVLIGDTETAIFSVRDKFFSAFVLTQHKCSSICQIKIRDQYTRFLYLMRILIFWITFARTSGGCE